MLIRDLGSTGIKSGRVQVSICGRMSKLKKPAQAALDCRILKVPMPSMIEIISVKNNFGIANALLYCTGCKYSPHRLETWKIGLVRIANQRRQRRGSTPQLF